jgi:hypothetical protein
MSWIKQATFLAHFALKVLRIGCRSRKNECALNQEFNFFEPGYRFPLTEKAFYGSYFNVGTSVA